MLHEYMSLVWVRRTWHFGELGRVPLIISTTKVFALLGCYAVFSCSLFAHVSGRPIGPMFKGPIECPETSVHYNENQKYEKL